MPHDRPTPLSTTVVSSSGAWRDAAAAWQSLAARGASIPLFQDYAWLSAWWDAIAANPPLAGHTELRTIILNDAHGVAAIAPLVLRRDRWPARLGWMALDVSDYCDLIAAPDLDATWVRSALRTAMAGSGAAVAELTQLRPDGACARLLGERMGTAAGIVKSPFIALAGRGWEEVEKGFSSQFRQEMRRKGRRLAKRVNYSYVEYEDATRRRAAVQFIVEQKRRQFADKPGDLAALESVFAPFALKVFAQPAIGAAQVHVAALEVEGRILAAHLGFVDAERFYYYVPAYDPEFQADSPGQLLIVELLRRAAEMRVPVFDMLRGDYAYKWRLTDSAVELRSIVEPLSLMGTGYLCLKTLAKRLKRS